MPPDRTVHSRQSTRSPRPFDDIARNTALEILCEFELGRSLERLFDDTCSGLEPRDRRFTRQLASGVTKWRARLDWTLDHFTKKPVASLPHDVLNILRLGLYQMLLLDRVPDRAAVHSAVELVKARGRKHMAGFVNAVLRRAAAGARDLALPDPGHDLAGYLSLFHSHPRWLVERWLQRWSPEEVEALLEYNNRAPRFFVRLNSLRADRSDLASMLPDGAPLPVAVEAIDDCFELVEPEGVFDSPGFERGLFWVQDASACIAAALLDPEPAHHVLDACSAPGGKTVQLAVAMGDEGRILACDRVASRLVRVRENSHRLCLGSVRLLVQDAEHPALLPVPTARFDRILLDVPCSSTGVLARLPEARWRRRPSDLAGHAARQLNMLLACYELLKPQGVIVYSTCSLEPEENEQVVSNFLARTASAVLEPARHFPSIPCAGDFVQSVPGQGPGDGAFAARIRRRAVDGRGGKR